MTIVENFTVGSLPGQIPALNYIQDSLFGGYSEVMAVMYNGNGLLPIYWAHNCEERRLYFGDAMYDGDVVTITINKSY